MEKYFTGCNYLDCIATLSPDAVFAGKLVGWSKWSPLAMSVKISQRPKILKWRKGRSRRKNKAHENWGNVTKEELDDGKFVQSVTNWWICTHCICASLSPELEKTCKLGICKSSKKSGPRDESFLYHYSNIRFVTCEATTSLKQTRWNWFGKVSDMASWPRNFVWEMSISWMTGRGLNEFINLNKLQ